MESASALTIRVETTDQAVIVRLSGQADAVQSDVLRERLRQLVSERPPLLVVDMKQLDFIGSAGLGALVEAHVSCHRHAGRLCLLTPPTNVLEVLRRTRLTELLQLCDDEADALRP